MCFYSTNSLFDHERSSFDLYFFSAKSMVKGSKGDSSNDPKASTDSSTTIEDDDPKGEFQIRVLWYRSTPKSYISTFLHIPFDHLQ